MRVFPGGQDERIGACNKQGVTIGDDIQEAVNPPGECLTPLVLDYWGLTRVSNVRGNDRNL